VFCVVAADVPVPNSAAGRNRGAGNGQWRALHGAARYGESGWGILQKRSRGRLPAVAAVVTLQLAPSNPPKYLQATTGTLTLNGNGVGNPRPSGSSPC